MESSSASWRMVWPCGGTARPTSGRLCRYSSSPQPGWFLAITVFTGPQLSFSTCGWLSVNQLYWQQVYTTTHKILLSQKPVNIHGRMVARHQHRTRAAAGVSRGFGNLIVSTSFNHAASSYNNLPGNIRETHNMKEFKRCLKDWIQKNIKLWTQWSIYNFIL